MEPFHQNFHIQQQRSTTITASKDDEKRNIEGLLRKRDNETLLLLSLSTLFT